LEKFLHELSLHEEKIFLKRYELREVSYHPWQEFACTPHSAFVDVSVVALLAEITSQDTA
jgi:hypothetical protein